jgi:tyrosine-protein kinase Etk/Wzc
MKTQAPIEFRFDSINLLNFLVKYYKLLFLTGIVTLVISSGVSLIITPRFKSTAVIFPSPNVLETRSLLNTQNTATVFFGDEASTEMVLQIIESDKIHDYLVNKYNLLEHYKINSSANKYSLLDKKMRKNISSRKTQFNSIEIIVYDTEPVVAADIANDIATQVDSVFNYLRKEAALKSCKVLSELYNSQLMRINSIEDSLVLPVRINRTADKSGIALFNSEIRQLLISSTDENDRETLSQYRNEAKGTPDYFRLINTFVKEADNLAIIQSKLLEEQTFSKQDLQYVYIIKEAKTAEIKATPKRTIIVAVSTISTILLMIILLLVLDSVVRNEK